MTTGDQASEQESTSPTVSRVARREPIWMLVLGILLFLTLQAFSWWDVFHQPLTAPYQTMETARISTFMTTFLKQQQLQRGEQYATLFSSALASTAAQGAELWEEIGEDATDASYRGKVLVNAAALHGAAGNYPAARKSLARAAEIDPARAQAYRQLALLYQPKPSATKLTDATAEVLSDVSSRWLIRSRNAELRGDIQAARDALQPGARAGMRLIIVNSLLIVIFGGVLFTAVVLWIARRKRIGDTLRAVQDPTAAPVPWGIGAALIIVSAVYLLTQAVGLVLTSALNISPDDLSSRLPLGAFSTIVSTLLVLSIVLAFQGKKPWEWAMFGWKRTPRGVWYGILGLLLTYPIIWAATLLSSLFLRDYVEAHPLLPALQSAQDLWLIIALVLMAVVMAPIVEETLFRGILFRALGDRMAFWPAALISATLFAIGHAQLVAILPILILGVLFAVLTRSTGSLLAPAAAHAVFNGMSTATALLVSWALRAV